MSFPEKYLHIGRASDLSDPQDRKIYRTLEIMPGVLMLVTFAVAILGSWLFPLWVAVFAIFFIIYWFIRIIYFAFHLQSSYRQMRKNEAIDWIEKLEELPKENYTVPVQDWRELYHVVVIPMFREPLDIIRQTLLSLKASDYPKDRFIVVLAVEENAGEEGRQVATMIEEEFKNEFSHFLVAFHPSNLPGEIAGKASNETWAAKQLKKEVIDPLGIPYGSVVYTSLDADTIMFPRYFSCLTYQYLTIDTPTRTSFQPVPLFFNNIWDAPAISRVFSFNSTFWHMMNQMRAEKLITFSTHSMSFAALVDVGFKQVNVVSDDSRIFWQCYLKYNGNYKTQPILYPVSMDANAAKSLVATLKNIYRQQRRWAYGVADVPYFFFGFLKNKEISCSKKLSPAWEIFLGFWSWATAPILIASLGWLPLILGGEEFSQSLLSYNLPLLAGGILRVGMLGLLGSIYLSVILLTARAKIQERRKVAFLVLQWILLPVAMIFSSFPAMEAQLRLMFGKYLGFWFTPKFRSEDPAIEPK